MVRLLKILAALALITPVVACGTVKGIGKDISAGGQVISDTSDEVKKEIKRKTQ